MDTTMEKYDFAGATTAVYAFWQYELCDVYIELVKPVMNSAGAPPRCSLRLLLHPTHLTARLCCADASPAMKRAMQDALYTALESGLRLLHPFMPFVTEELWQRLPRVPGVTEGVETIMLAPYPAPVAAWADAAAEADLELAMTVTRAVRSLRAAYGLLPKARPLVYVHARTDDAAASAAISKLEVGALAGAEAVEVLRDEAAVPKGCALEVISDAVSVYMNLKGAVDAKAEIEKLQKKIGALTKSADTLTKQAAAADYEVKVPERVRADNLEKLNKLRAEIQAAEKGIADFEALLA